MTKWCGIILVAFSLFAVPLTSAHAQVASTLRPRDVVMHSLRASQAMQEFHFSGRIVLVEALRHGTSKRNYATRYKGSAELGQHPRANVWGRVTGQTPGGPYEPKAGWFHSISFGPYNAFRDQHPAYGEDRPHPMAWACARYRPPIIDIPEVGEGNLYLPPTKFLSFSVNWSQAKLVATTNSNRVPEWKVVLPSVQWPWYGTVSIWITQSNFAVRRIFIRYWTAGEHYRMDRWFNRFGEQPPIRPIPKAVRKACAGADGGIATPESARTELPVRIDHRGRNVVVASLSRRSR